MRPPPCIVFFSSYPFSGHEVSIGFDQGMGPLLLGEMFRPPLQAKRGGGQQTQVPGNQNSFIGRIQPPLQCYCPFPKASENHFDPVGSQRFVRGQAGAKDNFPWGSTRGLQVPIRDRFFFFDLTGARPGRLSPYFLKESKPGPDRRGWIGAGGTATTWRSCGSTRGRRRSRSARSGSRSSWTRWRRR